jgi:2-dehydropantoate 2-reductase
MKIAVMGAGAVGCYYGFKLARAGHDVVLIGRPQHVEAIGAAAIRPHLAPDALVLSLQNGVENADRLRALLQQKVVAAAVYVGTEMAASRPIGSR